MRANTYDNVPSYSTGGNHVTYWRCLLESPPSQQIAALRSWIVKDDEGVGSEELVRTLRHHRPLVTCQREVVQNPPSKPKVQSKLNIFYRLFLGSSTS